MSQISMQHEKNGSSFLDENADGVELQSHSKEVRPARFVVLP